MVDPSEKVVSVRELFLALQDELAVRLGGRRRVLVHPETKGTASELNWQGMLDGFLPARYRLTKAFVVDCDGQTSDQIDLVIHDRHYSPLLFRDGGACFVPAESVYGLVEVKQELDKETVEYAGRKAASVRRLRRTTAPIPHAGGTFDPKEPPPIFAAIVCLESGWNPPLGESLMKTLGALPAEDRLDLGCTLARGAFEATYPTSGAAVELVKNAAADTTLVFFCLRLLKRLQAMGTVPALDLSAWSAAL